MIDISAIDERGLEDILSEPTEATRRVVATLKGDIVVLGAGGKMGPTLAMMLKKGLRLSSVEALTLASQLTLANKAIFDADNHFAGCIPGISYVLKRQGLLERLQTLDPHSGGRLPAEQLSPGQAAKIDKIIRDYPHLTDDDFVKENLDVWLS